MWLAVNGSKICKTNIVCLVQKKNLSVSEQPFDFYGGGGGGHAW